MGFVGIYDEAKSVLFSSVSICSDQDSIGQSHNFLMRFPVLAYQLIHTLLGA